MPKEHNTTTEKMDTMEAQDPQMTSESEVKLHRVKFFLVNLMLKNEVLNSVCPHDNDNNMLICEVPAEEKKFLKS